MSHCETPVRGSINQGKRSVLDYQWARHSANGPWRRTFIPSRPGNPNDSKRRELVGNRGSPPAPIANHNRCLYTSLIRSTAQCCPAMAATGRQTM